MTDRNLFTDYLTALGVAHTETYSRRRFMSYPHKLALMATGDLLSEYGVAPTELGASAGRDIGEMRLPAVAALSDGSYVIVLGAGDGKVRLRTRTRKAETVAASDFSKLWTGAAVWGVPQRGAGEPHVGRHRFVEVMSRVQRLVFAAGLAFIAAYCMAAHGIYRSWAHMALAALYGAGVYVTWLLVLKDNGVHSGAAEKMCGVIESGGCGRVLDDSSSKLFGLYPWCEIGLTYFSVSLTALLVWPACTPWLAAFSVCCLPYTVWSVAYQKFKIHSWCTLCLTVQTLMWVIFGVMVAGRQFGPLTPVPVWAVVLAVCYVTGFLGLHRLVGMLNLYEKPEGAGQLK